MTTERWQIWFSGRVQGVGFRYHARLAARQLGVTGYVRNLDDGRVEVCAEGAPEVLQRLLDALLEDSPGYVTRHQLVKGPPTGQFPDFSAH